MSAAIDADEAARAVRAEVRVRQLLQAATRLMGRDGSESVSMQAVATEAGVSVGLIYRYFGGKDDLLLAVIMEVLDALATRVPEAVARAADDPVLRLAAAFRSYCEVIDQYRDAAVLTYRESKALSPQGREQIKQREVTTSAPLRACIVEATQAGLFRPVDPSLMSYNLLLLAHGWALKHWYFERTLTFDQYVADQTALALESVLNPRYRRRYAGLLGR